MLYIIKFIILVISTFFVSEIITNKKKGISILGTVLICFSTAVVEYIDKGLIEALVFGEGSIIFLNEFLNREKREKYIFSLGFFISIALFFILTNLSWQISIGTLILGLMIWVFIKNKKSINKKSVICLVVGTAISLVVTVFLYEYKVIKSEENENLILYLTSYFYYYILPFNDGVKYSVQSALTTMISVFPIPFILSLIYINKYEKHMEFIVPVAGVGVIQLFASFLNLVNGIVPNYIMAISISIAQIFLIMYFFANITENIFNITNAAYATLAYLVLVAILAVPTAVSKQNMRMLMAVGCSFESYILFLYGNEKIKKLAPVVFSIISVIGFVGMLV